MTTDHLIYQSGECCLDHSPLKTAFFHFFLGSPSFLVSYPAHLHGQSVILFSSLIFQPWRLLLQSESAVAGSYVKSEHMLMH